MLLKIKADNENIHNLYNSHSTFHEGDSGIDLFVPEKIIVPGKTISFNPILFNIFIKSKFP